MSEVIDYALALVETIRATGVRATADVRTVNPPGVLVVPTPAREYDLLGDCFTATWTVALIGSGPGDLSDARLLEDYAAVVIPLLPRVDTVEVASYVLPGLDPKPAYLCRFQTTVTEEQ